MSIENYLNYFEERVQYYLSSFLFLSNYMNGKKNMFYLVTKKPKIEITKQYTLLNGDVVTVTNMGPIRFIDDKQYHYLHFSLCV